MKRYRANATNRLKKNHIQLMLHELLLLNLNTGIYCPILRNFSDDVVSDFFQVSFLQMTGVSLADHTENTTFYLQLQSFHSNETI